MQPTPYQTIAAAVCRMAPDVLSVEMTPELGNWRATVTYSDGKHAYGHGDSPFSAVESARGHARHFAAYFAECDRTAAVVADMMQENTGTHMLDSGDHYGRNWQRNQGRDFAAEPYGHAEFWNNGGKVDLLASVSTYHFLTDRLLHDEAMQARLDAFADELNPNTPWLQVMEEFAEFLQEEHGASGLYGDGNPMTINTYNHDSVLSQVIQYVYFELDGQGYVLLQIHGGCDARGGYTAPKAFISNGMHGDMDSFLLGDSDMRLVADDSPLASSWYTDDASNFYWDGEGDGLDFSEYPATDDPALRGKGAVYIDDDNNGYCPLTGCRLVAS